MNLRLEGTDVFSLAFEAADVGLALSTPAGRLISVNDAFASAFGYTSSELTAEHLSVLFPLPLAHPAGLPFQTEFQQIGERRKFSAVGKDGRIIFGEVTTREVFDSDEPLRLHTLVSVKTSERRLTEETWSLALRASKTGVWTRDIATDQVDWSPELEEIFGLEPGGFGGSELAFFLAVHPEDRELVFRAVEEAILSRNDYQVEFRFNHSDGSIRWMDGRGRAIYDSQGRPVMLTGVGIDITDRKETEVALQRSEERYRLFFQMAGVGAATVDPATGLFTSVNDRMCDLTGYSREELLAKTRVELTHEDDLNKDQELYDKLCSGEVDTYTTVKRYIRKDGAVVWLHGDVSMLRDDIGKPISSVALVQDVTERKRTEQALRTAEIRTQMATEAAGIGVWQWNLETQEVTWSDLVRTHFGLAPDEKPCYQTFLDHVHPDDRKRVEKSVRRSVIEQEEFNVECRTVAYDGVERWIIGIGRRGADTLEGTFFGITLDITERKEAEEYVFRLNHILEQRVEERTQELAAANRELEGFTYTVSHDLRAPLRAIMATSRILLEDFRDVLPPDAETELKRQAQAAKKLGVLIDDLLKLSRLGRDEVTRARCDISAIAAEIVDELGRSPAEIDVQPGLEVEADPKLIRLALQNLFENSVKFASKDRPLRVQVGRHESGCLFVRDNGIGFEPAYSDRIFMPFERLHRDQEYPGTGIGLANVKRIVERHGGHVWAEGKPGEGATFFFTL